MSGQNNDKEKDKWYTIAEASRTLNISTRTIQRRIEKGEYNSKKQGHNRLVLIPEQDKSHDIDFDIITTLKQNIKHLEAELEESKTRLKKAEEEAKDKDVWLTKERERHDTITVQKDAVIMQLTRQLGDAQKALEMKNMPWWKRLRLDKDKKEDEN